MIEVAEERPVYVDFETRPVEDRAETLKHGRPIYKNVPFAIITPPGGKSTIEIAAERWLEKTSTDKYAHHYRELFKAWKHNEETPVEGTPLNMWPGLTPAEVKQIKRANIRTVEDLAQANDEALRHIGMGGVALRDRAKSYLMTAASTGVVSEQLAMLKADKKRLEETVDTMQAQIDELKAAVGKPGSPAPKKRGRPKKDVSIEY